MKNIIFPLVATHAKYKQIYEQFKRLIEQGDLPPNEQLPSIRQLAESLQVSRNTTLTAYEQLTAEGYIRGEGRRGYFVNELEPQLFQQTAMPASQSQAKRTYTVDFRAGAVDQAHFPLKAWRKISNAALTMPYSFFYGEPFGELALREQIAMYLLESRGVKTSPDTIIIGSSTQQMLMHLGHILKQDFQSIIVEDPGYDGARAAFSFHQFALETVPVNETGTDLSHLDTLTSRLMYVTPSHQCPIGVSLSIQQRQKLIQWVNARGGYIIEDDYDSEFRYTQKPFPALASIDATRVIYLGNFSKSFLPGIRLSYMVLPEQLLACYKQQFQTFESTTSVLSQLAMAKFMEEGEWSRHIKRMRLVYKRKMQCLVRALRKHFEDRITIIGEQSGLYVLVNMHDHKSEQWFIDRAAEHSVKVYPTNIYDVHARQGATVLQLGFSAISCEEIERGVAILAQAWR